jgi:hypothetical protein
MNPATITYRRAGRQVRAKGMIVRTNPETGLFRIQPARPRWKAIWISAQEIQQGGSIPASPAEFHHCPAVGRMVDGLRWLLDRKESLTPTHP